MWLPQLRPRAIDLLNAPNHIRVGATPRPETAHSHGTHERTIISLACDNAYLQSPIAPWYSRVYFGRLPSPSALGRERRGEERRHQRCEREGSEREERERREREPRCYEGGHSRQSSSPPPPPSSSPVAAEVSTKTPFTRVHAEPPRHNRRHAACGRLASKSAVAEGAATAASRRRRLHLALVDRASETERVK